VECRVEPVVLTADNVAEFAFTDLVLPLPGYDVKYPDNETAAWYRELLANDGFEDFSFRNRVKLVQGFITLIHRGQKAVAVEILAFRFMSLYELII